MKKIILILLFMCSFAFADYTFQVENTTMVDAYYNIFNAIAALFQSQDYIDLLRLVFLLGGFFVFLGVVMNASNGANAKTLMPYAKYLGFGVVILTVIFSSKETVWITSKTLPSFCSTSSPSVGFAVELPSVLGFGFTTINKIGSNLTEMAETAFTAPNASGTSSMSDSDGYLGSLKQTIKVLSLDPEKISGKKAANGTKAVSFTSLIENHFATCVYNVAQNKTQGKDKLAEMNDSKNLYKWTKDFLDFTFDGSSMKTGEALITKDGSTISCREHFLFLDEAVNSLKEKYSCMLPLAHGGVLELITGTTSGTESKMTEIIVQSGLISALETSSKTSSIVSGANYASGKTRAEFTQTQMASGAYMAEMLPYIQMTMRAVLYGFFPFVFVIILLPGGLKVLIQYGQTMLWIELWGPTAAVINMFVNLKAKEQLSTLYDESGLSMMTSIDMLTESSTIAGYGAYLYMSVPALTWLILKGSGHMLGNITGSISAGYAGNLKSEGIAKDVAMKQASASTGKSVTSLINSIEGSQVANKVADARGFDAVGMQKTISTKTTTNKAQRLAEIEKVATQGGDESYIKTQVTKSGYDAVAEKTDTDVKTDEGGKQVVSDNQFVKTSTDLQTTKKEINSAGSKKAVVQNKSDMNNKSFNKDLEVNKNTSVQDYKNLGKKESADTNATSHVVEKEGTKGFYDSKVQNLKTESDTAKIKKIVAGSNEKASKVDTDKNISGFKTDKKTFDKYSTDTTSSSDFEKKKEDITKTLETKNSIEKKGYSDTEDFYKNEAVQSAEDRKAQVSKADVNNDNNVDSKEAKNYGKDMTIKSISDQNALKSKNDRLIENGQKMLSSENADVRNTMNNASNTYKAHGDDVALAAGALATQTSIATKEQRFTSDEKSEYVDQMEAADISGVDKADTQVQKDAEDIEKTNSETESFVDISKEQNGIEKYNNIKENFKDQGMNELEAQNATLFATAKNGKMNSDFTDEVFSNNLHSIKKDMNSKLENRAKEEGVIKDNDKEFLNKSEYSLKKSKSRLEKRLAKFDEERQSGALEPRKAIIAQSDAKALEKVNYNLDNYKKLKDWSKTDSDAQKIIQEGISKTDNLVSNMKAMNIAKEDENGNLNFGDSHDGVNKEDLTMSQKVKFRKEKGSIEGNKVTTTGADGRNYQVVTDLSGKRVTNFSSAKMGYSNSAENTYDKTYALHDATNGKYMKETAIASSVVDNVKGAVGYIGAGKFLAGK
ncbi:conjugal transfer protein TraG N-terminal domain-containing protein [Poseidonibacter ostreae]|uniref:TraG N-terminal Proteobacteria domain-containing protein n=1 Tax=Poseidonibacter ostreae TaxID=2654171 RepID=A0A6L4WTZ0_9BACT|nr:conjugal transfer protein TraG N-terminal domain-containing protein [Poseidonibacter ostreae]KAB7889564.1 hypothetical protein GBG19_05775 [Poseidonibacter ostreae]